MQTFKSALGFSMVILLLTTRAFAQTATTAQITGLVSDAQSGVLPGATATLRDQSTNQTRTTITNSSGRYVFPNLEPGVYELTVNLDQFKTSVTRNIPAQVTRTVTQDIVRGGPRG